MSGGQERSDSGRYCALHIPEPDQRRDLGVFIERALRLDPAAVVRLRMRSDGLLGAWVATGLDVLACRVVAGSSSPADVTYGADHLLRGLTEHGSPYVDAGLPMDSAWRGALPGEAGFVHVEGGAALNGTLVSKGLLDAVNLTVAPMIAGGAEQRIITGAPAATTGLSLVHAFAQGDHLFTRWERPTPDR